MKLNLYTECDIDFLQDYEKIATEVLINVLQRYACPFDVQAALYIVTPEEIRETNAQTRQIDKVTDVLSFPNLYYEPGKEGDFSGITEDDADLFDPETGELMLGEIMICAEKVYAQAEEYGHGVVREFAFLVAHSALHLLGYDHMEDAERERMETLQEEILKEAGYERK
ncbi:MAG: rRNA maturation RNase YbeY [Lachnospiraceae bacterium]|nr:rRNA maturation RNase YbeY [Lachnospiraceae bacterium]